MKRFTAILCVLLPLAALAQLSPTAANLQAGFSAYPNPTTGKITLEQLNGPLPADTKVTVSNMLGDRIKARGSKVNEQAFALNMAPLPAGTYLVVIERPSVAPEVLRIARQ